MIFINEMKDFKVYKTPMFLPTLDDDKKRKSAILLMTPDYNSSKKILGHPLFVNKLRYASYYIERDVSYYVNSKNLKDVNEFVEVIDAEEHNTHDVLTESANYIELLEMSSKERNKLPDHVFGLPKKRKYPLDTIAHVKSAIRFFNYVDNKEDEKELATNIIRAANNFNMNVTPGKNNRLRNYIVNEACKDVETARRFVADVGKLARKYDANYFIVTDGASGTSNKGNPAVKNARDAQIEWEKKNGFDPDEDWTNSIKERVEPRTTIDNPDVIDYSIKRVYGVKGNDGLWNALVDVEGFSRPLRARSEMIVVNKKDKTVFLLKKGDFYEFPGGGWDPNEDHMATAIRETKEEARITVTNVKPYLSYIEDYDKPLDWVIKTVPKEYWFTGFYTELFIGEFGEKYEGGIEDIDQDNDMATKAKFYPISEVKDMLRPIHYSAICAYLYGGLGDEFEDYNALNAWERNRQDDIYIKTESFLNEIPDTVLNTGDKVIFFGEDAKNDSQLKRMIYNDRMKNRKEVILLYDQVKKDFPFIKYTYPDLDKYQKKNVFIDFYFYNNLFFENNTWAQKKGIALYLDFLNRLVNNPNIKSNGYEKKTLFIPVSDWDKNKDGTVWNHRSSLNPLSLIYYMMYNNLGDRLLSVFGDMDLVFVGSNTYFKINFAKLTENKEDIKKLSIKFKLFLIKICKNEEFDSSDIDTTADNSDSSQVIKAKIADRIELSKGVDITPQLAKVSKEKDIVKKPTSTKKKIEEPKNDEDDKVISKGTLNQEKSSKEKKQEQDIEDLANAIDRAADRSNSEEDALDALDYDEVKKILIDLDSTGEDKVDITSARASRINELDAKLLQSEVNGKSIKDILDTPPNKELKKTTIEVASPNAEEWSNLTYTNLDKDFDIDKHIITCFRFFETVSRPIAIRNIEVTDNSTSEDRLSLYRVEMEDYRGKRFTVKLDIPIMKDNRFLLRGNYNSIQTQLFNMPIIKVDEETCQIISNYMKIIVSRFGTGSGKSLPATSKFVKASNKYQGRSIKFYPGNNAKVCSKYELPIDYLDLARVFSKIETSDFIVYFNQDEIRNLYEIDESKGIPWKYDKKEKEVYYIKPDDMKCFIYMLIESLEKYTDFMDLFNSASAASVSVYSRCKVMSSQIPTVVVCAYHEGLRKTLEKAGIDYNIRSKLDKETKYNPNYDWIKFKDGYIVYYVTYASSLLMNGLKICPTDMFEISDIDNRDMYLEFLDSFGGRIKADGLDNFYDCMIDPFTKETLEFYKFPTDYVSVLLYANALLADNKFIKHTDTCSRRMRRYELIAVYCYKVLSDAYASYANQLKHSREAAEFMVKQSAVIDKFLADSISSPDSCINALRDVETTNAMTTKGPSGMNSERAYSLDKRTYDESMLNVIGMSTGFSGNVGITRQATINANIEGDMGFIKGINGDTSKMNTVNSLTITEALTPFGSNRDDPMRTAMTFIQTSKHMVRTEDSDPLLVTNGSDEALPYLTTDKFAFKAKKDGKIEEITDEYILVAYNDGTKDYINLTETIEFNSDGGYYVPLKLDVSKNFKVGSSVKENQILAYDKYSFSNSVGESDNIAYNIGKLAKVAIINSDECIEDSGIMTQKLADHLATRINIKSDAVIDKDSILLSIAKVGQHVESGDDIIVWQAPFDEEDANSLMKSLTSEEVSELGKRKVKSKVTGTITGIKIYRTVDVEELSDSLKKLVKSYEAPLIKLEKKLRENNLDISQVPAHTKLDPTGKLKKAQDAVFIEIFTEYLDTPGVGDKVVYFSANKAVEKNIIPIGLEPYTDFRPNETIDAFVSEISIDKRMVTSTLIYGSLQKLMIELDRSVKDIMGIPYDDSKV